MNDRSNKCPTCGQSVRISVSEEGTGCFLPDSTNPWRKMLLELISKLEIEVQNELDPNFDDSGEPLYRCIDKFAQHYRALVEMKGKNES